MCATERSGCSGDCAKDELERSQSADCHFYNIIEKNVICFLAKKKPHISIFKSKDHKKRTKTNNNPILPIKKKLQSTVASVSG